MLGGWIYRSVLVVVKVVTDLKSVQISRLRQEYASSVVLLNTACRSASQGYLQV